MSRNLNISQQYYSYLLACIILFVVSPLLAIGFLMMLAFYSNENLFAKPVLILLPVLIFIVQMTRVYSQWEIGDWPGYARNYHLAAESSFMNYLANAKASEIVWPIIQYVGNKITFNNFILYASLIVATTFGISGLAVYRFWKWTGTNVRYLIAALAMTFFIYEFIGISNNLLRMQFAMSIMAYAIVERYTTGKILWWLIIIDLMIHSAVILLIPFFFLKSSKPVSIKHLAYILSIALIFSIFLSLYSNALTGSSIYIFHRIGSAYLNLAKQTDVIDTVVIYYFSFVVLLAYIKVNYIDKINEKWRIEIYNFAGLFCLICIFLRSMPLVATRFYISRFFFLPLFFPYLFLKEKDTITIVYLFGVFIFFYLRFCFFQSHLFDIPGNILGVDLVSILNSSPHL